MTYGATSFHGPSPLRLTRPGVDLALATRLEPRRLGAVAVGAEPRGYQMTVPHASHRGSSSRPSAVADQYSAVSTDRRRRRSPAGRRSCVLLAEDQRRAAHAGGERAAGAVHERDAAQSGTCTAGCASPRSWRTASITFVMPPRLVGWLLHSPPPSVLNGSRRAAPRARRRRRSARPRPSRRSRDPRSSRAP